MGFNNGYDSGYDDGFVAGVKTAQQSGGSGSSGEPSTPVQTPISVTMGSGTPVSVEGHIVQLVVEGQSPEYDPSRIPVCWCRKDSPPNLDVDNNPSEGTYSDIFGNGFTLFIKGENFDPGEDNTLFNFRGFTVDFAGGSTEIDLPGVYLLDSNMGTMYRICDLSGLSGIAKL